MQEKKLSLWQTLPANMRPKVRYWLPAAAMDEQDLRTEIRRLGARGFGGIEVVVLASVSDEIIYGEDGWGTPNWNKMVDIIAQETKALGMTMDIANGPAWPISVPTVASADDPAALCELTWGELDIPAGTAYDGPLPKPRICHDEGQPLLVQALAYEPAGEKILRQDSYINLNKAVGPNGRLSYTFGPNASGSWKVFAFYRQPACQKTNGGQCYVIDHLSRAGAQACRTYWDAVFENRQYDSLESIFCDSLEYEVALEWTPGLEQEFEKRRGYSLLPYLPFVGMADTFPACDIPGYALERREISDMINRDFKETLTQCYCENHLSVLEEMAGRYGKTIRYQVAYNKPFEVERCGLYVGIPENEALGRPSVDFQKTMAAAVHLGRKERYSFECAAEPGHSYGQDYEDLFWWVKRSLLAGMNAQVLHGASYSGKYTGKYSVNGQLPDTQWPGFEAFGKFVSNYWNRTLSESDARGCMDAMTRLNMIFRKKARVDCAIFRNSYGSNGLGGEFCLYADNGLLSNRGYSYETVTEALLALPVCTVSKHMLDADGAGYRCLIIPPVPDISKSMLLRVQALAGAGLPVVWVGPKPVSATFYGEWDDKAKRDEWRRCLDAAWFAKGIVHADTLEMVPDTLEKLGIYGRISLDGSMDLMTAVREDEEENICYFAVYGYNRVKYIRKNPFREGDGGTFDKDTLKENYKRPGRGSRKTVFVRLSGTGSVWACEPWSGKIYPMDFADDGCGGMTGQISIEKDELVLLALIGGEANAGGLPRGNTGEHGHTAKDTRYCPLRLPVHFDTLELVPFEPDTDGEVSFLRSGFAGTPIPMTFDKLLPWRYLSESLEHFAGKGIYKGGADIECLEPECRYILELGNVSDTFTVFVNGQKADFPDQVMKRADISGLLKEGYNTLTVCVFSNLYNRLFSDNMRAEKIPLNYMPRDYGLWESEEKPMGIYVYKSR